MLTALIPARSGSKRVSGKNFRGLGNKALIDWTLEFALKSPQIDKIIVSLDEKCEVSKSLNLFHFDEIFLNMQQNSLFNVNGNLWVHKRTDESARDEARTIDVLREIYSPNDDLSGNLVVLQPTSPFRSFEEFASISKVFMESNASSCVSVAETTSPHPLKSFRIDKSGKFEDMNFDVDLLSTPEQKLKQYFHLDGGYYFIGLRKVIESGLFVDKDTVFFKREHPYTLNIDNRFDFQIAEYLVENNVVALN